MAKTQIVADFMGQSLSVGSCPNGDVKDATLIDCVPDRTHASTDGGRATLREKNRQVAAVTVEKKRGITTEFECGFVPNGGTHAS